MCEEEQARQRGRAERFAAEAAAAAASAGHAPAPVDPEVVAAAAAAAAAEEEAQQEVGPPRPLIWRRRRGEGFGGREGSRVRWEAPVEGTTARWVWESGKRKGERGEE